LPHANLIAQFLGSGIASLVLKNAVGERLWLSLTAEIEGIRWLCAVADRNAAEFASIAMS
jgi:hypothetical protein